MADDRDLIAAYLDGVTELAPDERRRVEALIAADPEAAAEADATREMIDQLRALPVPEAPEGRALGDAIAGALPAARPARSRAPIYAGLAALAAMVVAYVATRAPTEVPPRAVAIESAPPPTTSSHIWLGEDNDPLDLDVDEAATAIDELAPSDDDLDYISWEPDPFGAQFGARIDAVDDAAMDRIEHWLEKG
jgi:anti-sigma factor RsiW